MSLIKDRIGIRYNRLVVIKFAGRDWNNSILWLCKCDCGNEKIVTGSNLQSGSMKSCGCLRRESISKRNKENIGKKHPCYTDGKWTKEIYKLKEKIRKRDNYICQECNLTQKQSLIKYNEILSVHHIDGNDTNNNSNNMITLCRGCHIKIHKKGGLNDARLKNLEFYN